MKNKSHVPVYIVDDDVSVNEALCFVLEGYGYEVHSFFSGEDFMAKVNFQEPACVILDYRMPGMNGDQVHAALIQQNSCIEVMYLTSHGDLNLAVSVFRDGACDFHEKPVSAVDLIPSIQKAQKQTVRKLFSIQCRLKLEALTPREKELFNLVVKGMLNKQIADKLCISLRTVEVHRSKMMDKLEATKITELVKMSEALDH